MSEFEILTIVVSGLALIISGLSGFISLRTYHLRRREQAASIYVKCRNFLRLMREKCHISKEEYHEHISNIAEANFLFRNSSMFMTFIEQVERIGKNNLFEDRVSGGFKNRFFDIGDSNKWTEQMKSDQKLLLHLEEKLCEELRVQLSVMFWWGIS